jgi:regulator of Ty1 transposition protein 103
MDFVEAFSPAIADAIAIAYKGAPAEIQGKLRRVVDVWRDRRVFEEPIQDAIDFRMAGEQQSQLCSNSSLLESLWRGNICAEETLITGIELDKARGSTGAAAAFGSPSPFGAPTVPAELAPIVASHQNVAKHTIPSKSSVHTANQDYDRVMDPAAPVPSAPVYAARLHGLLKMLASAENAVAESVKARKELLEALESLLVSNKETLSRDELQLNELRNRRQQVETKKSDVELAIMRGLNSAEATGPHPKLPSGSPAPEPDRPEVEALTPPTMQDDADMPFDAPSPPDVDPPVDHDQESSYQHPAAPGIEMLSALASQYQSLPITMNGANKRRRLDETDSIPGLDGDDGIDADVAEILQKDST